MLRILIVLVSLAGAVLFALELGADRRCTGARGAIIESRARDDGALEDLSAHCRGTQPRLDAAGALRAADRDEQALRMAREAAQDEPENARAWRAVAALSTGAERSAARERLRELDPRSLKRRTGRSTR